MMKPLTYSLHLQPERIMAVTIRKNIIQLLKKRPLIFRPISKVYFALQPVHLMELFIGTKARGKRMGQETSSQE